MERKSYRYNHGLYWFTNDLRVHDNHLLTQALSECRDVSFIYVDRVLTAFDKQFRYGKKQGHSQRQFLNQAIADLDKTLYPLGKQVSRVRDITELIDRIETSQCEVIYSAQHCSAYYESQLQQVVTSSFPEIELIRHLQHTLCEEQQLPFEIDELPPTFTKFKNSMKRNLIEEPLPPCLGVELDTEGLIKSGTFVGGERAAIKHLGMYFDSIKPRTYKETRNSLDGWEKSTKFSAWLAFGCTSPRTVMAHLTEYEKVYGSNDSTYWIFFELMWREYFQWYAYKHQARLFAFDGITHERPLTSFYPADFMSWREGTTKFPIVNACMKQLAETGYMSNRGRQLVASCLVNELGLDWRYGAAYFESQLIDYDIASNWGNWQYIAGVGADPQGPRRFNLQKQTEMYDPTSAFIDKWCSNDKEV